MIDTGIGPVFAFCETWMKCTFIEFSIEAKCLDGAAPLHFCVVRLSYFPEWHDFNATSPLNCC